MQTPSAVLNIGADVAKDTIVVACSEGSAACGRAGRASEYHETAMVNRRPQE
jgi:hypothetical protein